jgi:hypothetical protein
MAFGKRSLVVAQAVLFGAAASKKQIELFLWTGNLKCMSRGSDEKVPYDPVAMKALVESGRMG